MEHEHDGENNSHVNIEDEVVQHTKGKKESTKFEHQCLESNRWSQYYLHKTQYADHIAPWKDLMCHQALNPMGRH